MAKKNSSAMPSFGRESKMGRYNLIFDNNVQQTRAGFFDKTLYKINTNVQKDDFIWTVEPGFEYRTDLISNKFYGTAKYDWIIEEINNIKDPIKDVKIGTKLRFMSKSRLFGLI